MQPNNLDSEPKKESVRKRYKQTTILLTILGLSICSEASTIPALRKELTSLYSAPGLLLLLALTEFKGRKPLFITLFSISIVSSIIYLKEYTTLAEIVQSIVQDATVLTAITICEYCDPKQRFVYLIVNFTLQRVTFLVTARCVQEYSEFGIYLQCFKIVIGLLCGGSVLAWPESPYWLASKRRFDDSRKAFLSIRSEDSKSDNELRTMMEERRGSAKMLYLPVLIACPFLLMAQSLDIEERFFNEFIHLFKEHGIWLFIVFQSTCALATINIAARISRRALVLSTFLLFAMSLVVYYSIEEFLSDCSNCSIIYIFSLSILLVATMCGPVNLSFPIFIEIIPQKYVTATTAAICVLFYVVSLVLSYLDSMIQWYPFFILLLSSVVVYFLLPEAKNKTLIEIEQLYLPKLELNQQNNQTDLQNVVEDTDPVGKGEIQCQKTSV